jgi:hypothetical protein
VGHRIPDLDTEPQEPATGRSVLDSDLSAPRIPALGGRETNDTLPEGAEVDPFDEQATADIGAPADSEPQVFASWEESRDLFVRSIVPPRDESPALRRKIYWITLALIASVVAQVGAVAAERLVPALVEHVREDDVASERVQKSARSLESARRLGFAVPEELEILQREAEAAVSSGDAALARRKMDALDARWSRRTE